MSKNPEDQQESRWETEIYENYEVLPRSVRIVKTGPITEILDMRTGKPVFCFGGSVKIKTDLSDGKDPKVKITFEANLTEMSIKPMENKQLELDLSEEAEEAMTELHDAARRAGAKLILLPTNKSKN